MKASTIRFADRWLGVPACALLTLWHRIFGRKPVPGPVKRILVLKLVEQGATVLAYPALKTAVDRVGAENVFFMVFEENRFILDLLEVVRPENVIAVRSKGILGTILGMLGAIRRVRRERIDAVVDFELFARSSAVLAYLSGASRRVGYHGYHGDGPWRGDLMTHRLVANPHLHMKTMMSVMVEALFRDPDTLPALNIDLESLDASSARFQPSPAETEKVRRLIAEASGKAGVERLVLLNANASDLLPLRKWDGERYVELAKRILREFDDVHIAFTGAPSERPAGEALVRKVGDPRCFSLVGRTSMRDLVVLYTQAEVLVTNDSGPAHFATLTDINVVTLFGPETPAIFGVKGPRSHVIWAGLPCSPCVNAANNRTSACRNNLCMQAISVEKVFAKVRQLLVVATPVSGVLNAH